MSRVVWDERSYGVGLDRGMFYPKAQEGVAWSGLVLFEDNEEDHISDLKFYDGQAYQRQKTPGNFASILSAYTYPDLFEKHSHKFDMSFRTKTESSYLIHLIYNARANLIEMNYEQEEPGAFRWNVSTTPEHLYGVRSSSHLIIDTGKAYPAALEQLEELLYGSHRQLPHMPSAEHILEVFEDHSILRIIDHRDGTWTAIGPDEAFEFLGNETFAITWPSAVYISDDAYTIHSL